MEISYKWLKSFLPLEHTPHQVADILTSIGLETGAVEEVETIKGGLKGLVVAQVLTCVDHPDSDHLHVTTVDMGKEEPLQVVCGASNVAVGQKIILATVGTVLYNGEESFQIKKSKIRGVESFGMICAEDEIGVGLNHDGIMVLPQDTPIGMAASDYFQMESDYVLEVDITPNRADAMSHYGVARDLAAALSVKTDQSFKATKASVDGFAAKAGDQPFEIRVDNTEACPRYAGLTIRGVQVKESPSWLKDKLTVIGLKPINNVVDVTNYVLHEVGQPLHAFDGYRISSGKVVVKTLPQGTPFTTLDGQQRKLSDKDLMICNDNEPMCIAGVFGGLHCGVTESTETVFLESAYFNPVWVRKTARRHGLNTDASFRFERGIDPNITIYALKRAALLIQEVAGGEIIGDIVDRYPCRIKPFDVNFSFDKCNQLIGQEIERSVVMRIFDALEMEVKLLSGNEICLKVPPYRVDVQRECDVVEDILRIYGYNNIDFTEHLQSTLSYTVKPDNFSLQNMISEQLTGAGFHEILNNSLTSIDYYQDLKTWPAEQCVKLMNPLSNDLSVMRQTLLFGGLESLAYNINRRKEDIKFYEFGNCYAYSQQKRSQEKILAPYGQDQHLALWLTGKRSVKNWLVADAPATFYDLKGYVEAIIRRLGFSLSCVKMVQQPSDEIFAGSLHLQLPGGKLLAKVGIIAPKLAKKFEIDAEVCYAEIYWSTFFKELSKLKISYSELPKYPEVRRDLALLVDTAVTFAEIEKIVYDSDKKIIKRVQLFDVYEGKNLPQGKKSYAINVVLQDNEKTLVDQQVDAIMQKVMKNLQHQIGAQLR